jgi:hypothetical protein
MKLRIVSALLLSAMSINVMAYEGNGFKIISEKITHSPGFIGGFQETLPKKSIAPGYVNACPPYYLAVHIS